MALSHSPLIVTDGLVFMYDTGNRKSYVGEPTTNVNTFTLSDAGTDGSGQSSVGTRTLITDNHARIVDVSSNTRQHHLITGLTASTTYTISIMYKKLGGTPTFRFQIQDYSGSAYLRTIKFTNTTEIGIEDKEGWQQASWTFTLGSDANAVRIWYQDGADYTTYSHSFELKNPQLEAKSHATPFVDGTRSATQGLIDRTNNATINLSNASFDSDAQMVFDGTDDYINAAAFDMGTPTDITLECFIRFNGSLDSADRKVMHYNKTGGTNAVFQLRKGDSISRLMYQAHNGSQWYTMTDTDAVESDTWAHFMITHSGTSAIMYKNGVQSATATMGNLHWTNANNLLIGYRANSEYWKGDISIMKIYDRALTSAEVLQNYNAIKSRFGL